MGGKNFNLLRNVGVGNTSSPNSTPRRFPSCLLLTLLLYAFFYFHFLPSMGHPTGFSFCFFFGFLAIFILLSSNNNIPWNPLHMSSEVGCIGCSLTWAIWIEQGICKSLGPYRPVTGGGVMCTCWDIRSVNFFLLPQALYFTIRDGGASESAARML